jgi:hypothetical protein
MLFKVDFYWTKVERESVMYIRSDNILTDLCNWVEERREEGRPLIVLDCVAIDVTDVRKKLDDEGANQEEHIQKALYHLERAVVLPRPVIQSVIESGLCALKEKKSTDSKFVSAADLLLKAFDPNPKKS